MARSNTFAAHKAFVRKMRICCNGRKGDTHGPGLEPGMRDAEFSHISTGDSLFRQRASRRAFGKKAAFYP
jgi:hypothetical protein